MVTARAQIAKLWQLQALDNHLKSLGNALANPSHERKYAQSAAAAREALASFRSTEESLTSVKQKLSQYELDLASLYEETASLEKRLYSDEARSSKELSGIEQKIGLNKKKQAETEEHTLELMMQVEELETQLRQQRAASERNLRQFSAAKVELDQEIDGLRTQLQKAASERARLVDEIDSTWLERYEKMYKLRGPDVIARIDDSLCGGCRVVLPNSILTAAKTSESPTTCESCGRILYSP